MAIISNEELIHLQQASAEADALVADLLARSREAGNFGPRMKLGGDIGDYVVPPVLSWETLYAVVKDDSFDIDYSIQKYPAFDGLVDEYFNSDEFINPLNSRYEKWQNLRDNIACVRNFLMIHYFEQNPNNVSEQAAEDAMEAIAKFIGKGCYNNFLFLGMIPNHNPLEDFIDIEKASAPDGSGARYIYERILAKNRSSTWLKPFDAVIRFFSGSGVSDWQLPATEKTPFDPNYLMQTSDAYISEEMIDAAIDEANRLRALLAKAQSASYEQAHLQRQVTDLDNMGNHLLFGAASAHHVVGLQEPVRRDAVEIAKDILRKLKVSIGDINIKDGLRLNPDDDVATIGGIKGVMMVFEKMLANASANNAAILNHPAVISATQAFGQIGYLAKLEAFRFATQLGDTGYAKALADQMRRIPDFYAQATHPKLGDLLDRISTGMDVVLQRMHQISDPAAMLSMNAFDTVGTSMNTPTAGLQAQVAAAIGVQGNMQAQQAAEAAEAAARAKANALLAANARQSGQSMATSNPVANSGSGRSMLADAKKAASTSSKSTPSTATIDPRILKQPQVGLTSAQQQQVLQATRAAERVRRMNQGAISPLVLEAMQRAQLKMSGVQNDHAHDHNHDTQPAQGYGLKPTITPNTKAPKPEPSKAGDAEKSSPANLAEAEELRRKNAAKTPQGRSH